MDEEDEDKGGMRLDRLFDQIRRERAGFDVLFPKGKDSFVVRLRGEIPDAYDIIAASVQFERLRQLHQVAVRILESQREDEEEDGRPPPFRWDEIGEHAILLKLQDWTVSMGIGKGRKEGVEIAKAAQPRSRPKWRWRRGD